MGAILVVMTAGVLLVDERLKPLSPFLLGLLVILSCVACHEMLMLLPAARRPPSALCYGAVLSLIGINWYFPIESLVEGFVHQPSREEWFGIAGVFAGIVLAAFLVEMARFRESGESLNRIALTVLIVAYLGLLPCFLAQLRWTVQTVGGHEQTLRLAFAIFVPKCCDIGAYFTGRFLGRHKMAPVLSPKKTWEGAAGGIATAVLATVGINRLGPVLPSLVSEMGFGITVGIAGMLGDLAESLIKRDCQQKDASQVVPGFGGVLDVVDAVLFGAPVAYMWFRFI